MNEKIVTRFWAKVEKTKTCWPWNACCVWGYGQFGLAEGKRVRAHRLAYELLVGPIPIGKVIDHICRNRACVNPDHLRITTHRENILCGIGLSAQNSRKTKCKRGHPFVEENIYRSKKGRECLKCKKFLHQRSKLSRGGQR